MTIGEAKKLKTMKLEELIGSLRTFEKELEDDKKLRKKTVTFQVEPQQPEGEEGDDLGESMTLLTKNFNQVARKMNRRMKGTFQTKNMTPTSNMFAAHQKFHRHTGGNPDQKKKFKGIQCRECEGYNHVQAECDNTCKKKKSYTVTWSDEETEDQNEGEEVFTDSVALISIIVPKVVSTTVFPIVSLSTVDEPDAKATKEESGDEEEISYEEMAYSYKVMYEKLEGAVTENRGLLK